MTARSRILIQSAHPEDHTTPSPPHVDSAFPIIPQKIETQTVAGFANLRNQSRAHTGPTRRIHQALENRVLHPLAEVLAELATRRNRRRPSSVSVFTSYATTTSIMALLPALISK